MKKGLILSFILLLSGQVFSQTIKGKIIEANGNPLPGASILIKETKNGVQTDFDGVFAIKANTNDKLVISYIGYINQEIYEYSKANPKNFKGYSENSWGLTASNNNIGYAPHSPTNDLGIISPTAALSSFLYTPTESLKALEYFYYTLNAKMWGKYGFYDAFSEHYNWYDNGYLAIDQGPIVAMIENYRTQLLWNLFMKDQEIKNGLTKLGFTSPKI
jgi:hypothetical protein